MPYLTLALNGFPVDLPADAAVALSYRANDLRNLDSREAAFSESFTLPNTARNRAVLGNPHSLDSLTTTPYRLLPAVLTSPGGVDILTGFAILELSHEGFDVTLTDALGSLFSQVGDLGLRELDLSAYDHRLSYAAIAAAQANTYLQGYCYPLTDTGVLTSRPADKGANYDEVPAAVYYHTLLTAIVQAALPGYRLTGSLLTEDTYRRAVLPRTTAHPQLRSSYLEPYEVLAYTADPFNYTRRNNPDEDIPFPLVEAGSLFAGLLYSPPPHPISLKIELTIRVNFTQQQSFSNPLLTIRTREGGAGAFTVLAGTPITQGGVSTVTLSADVPYLNATPLTQIYVHLNWSGVVSGNDITLFAGGKLTISPSPRAWPDAYVHLDAGLPDMSQADFLKLVFNQFNVITQADPVLKTVRLDLFNDLERNRDKAVDWTPKLDFTQRPRLAYVLEDYAQRNLLRYAEVPDVYRDELVIPAPPRDKVARGQGELPCANATLPATGEAYASDLLLPLPHATTTGPLAWLPFFKYVAPDNVSVRPYLNSLNYENSSGIILYKGRYWVSSKVFALGGYSSKPPREGSDWMLLTESAVYETLSDEVATVALVTPYAPSGDVLRVCGESGASFQPAFTLTRDKLPFTDLLPAYYPGLANILQRVQVLTLDVRLTALDISNLDFTRPVKFDVPHAQGYGKLSCLAYLNDIDQYQPSEPGPVACTFLVLGNPVPGLAPTVGNPPVRPLRILVTQAGQLLLSEDGFVLLAEI